jgi:hypothetical protein
LEVSLVPPDNCQYSTTRASLIPFLVLYPPVILIFDAVHSKLLAASFNSSLLNHKGGLQYLRSVTDNVLFLNNNSIPDITLIQIISITTEAKGHSPDGRAVNPQTVNQAGPQYSNPVVAQPPTPGTT